MIAFDNAYRRLPARFHAALTPARAAAPSLIAFNAPLAEELGLDAAALEPMAAEIFSGNLVPAGAEPIALAYAGHQFGNFVPQLGDGRALLLGEVIDRDGARRDIQLKGSGPTPFSRRGDGRAALGPVLREYIVSEAMHAMGIPTTRALAAVATGETVWRETPLPGAVLTRVAASHIRIGTFQYFAARQDAEALKLLADHAIARHDPALADEARPYLALLGAVAERQARLVAQWMAVGFIHGVMNTDNMTISGETIDYGPCAFLDGFARKAVFSSIDQNGRYAYANQPAIAQWNLARLAETLLFLIDDDIDAAIAAATEVLSRFPQLFSDAWTGAMGRKLGLATRAEGDAALATKLLDLMEAEVVDFTLAFRSLSEGATAAEAIAATAALFRDRAGFEGWAGRWTARLAEDGADFDAAAARMRAANPAIIPRNHRIEEAIEAAVTRGDFAPFHTLAAATRQPFADIATFDAYRAPPTEAQRVRRTFCGT